MSAAGGHDDVVMGVLAHELPAPGEIPQTGGRTTSGVVRIGDTAGVELELRPSLTPPSRSRGVRRGSAFFGSRRGGARRAGLDRRRGSRRAICHPRRRSADSCRDADPPLARCLSPADGFSGRAGCGPGHRLPQAGEGQRSTSTPTNHGDESFSLPMCESWTRRLRSKHLRSFRFVLSPTLPLSLRSFSGTS